MVAVTQLIPNYIGGVSSQADEKKQPGQVIAIDNGFTDPTFGLTKRNGFQYITTIETYTDTDDELKGAHWFFINRGGTEVFFGAITTNQKIRIWNAITSKEATVTIETNAEPYLTAGSGKNDYDVLTIRAQSFVVNKSIKVEEQPRETYELGRNATIKLMDVVSYVPYTVWITIDGTRTAYTYNSGGYPDIGKDPPDPPLTADDILSDLQGKLNAITDMTATKFDTSIELKHATKSFQIDVKGGATGEGLECYQDEVGNSTRLAATSVDGRRVKVVNTTDDRASFFVKFIANDPDAEDYDEGGTGYWREDLGWDEDQDDDNINKLASPGLVDSTMPHALVFEPKTQATDPDKFTFKQIKYTDRLVGNNITNERPSFVGETISFIFLYSNRLGFLSTENVILSVSAEFENFYFASAQTTIDSDPIDLNCSSIRPAKLFAAIPQTQGLILFSENEQFNLYSDADQLKPTDAILRSISNYECTSEILPVDIGTSIVFNSKTPSYIRTMAMTTRGQDNSPIVVDIGKVAEDYVPADTTDLVASSQNSFISLSSQNTKDVYFYKFFNNGQTDIMQSWFKWEMTGDVQSLVVTNDQFFTVQKNNGEYNILGASIAQSANAGMAALNTVNPRVDMFYSPLEYKDTDPITYDELTDFSTIPKPYKNSDDYNPIVIQIKPITMKTAYSLRDLPLTYESDEYDDVGFLPKVTVDDSGNWKIRGDWRGKENILIAGSRYKFSVELPTTFFRNQGIADYTAVLTVSRYKFSFGDTGLVEFKSKALGDDIWNKVEPVPLANYYDADSAPFTSETIITVPIYQKNKYFNFKIEADGPAPVTLNSMMWEGQYSPRYYKRVG